MKIILKKEREKSLLRHHPWIFEGAIAKIIGKPSLGETVEVLSFEEKPLGHASFSPHSQIRARMWTFAPNEQVDEAFFSQRIQKAVESRRVAFLENPSQTACRLIAAESDEVPGLIVDRYTDVLVCQFLTAGAEFWKQTILSCLQKAFPAYSIYERSDVDVRQKEGLTKQIGLLSGAEPPAQIEIQEGAAKLMVDIRKGHKTGFYLDQRNNRALLGTMAKDKTVLNCFSYSGGFSLSALHGGAKHVLNVDGSASALALSRQNHLLNGFEPASYGHIEADIFKLLREYKADGVKFDIIVLDPPKFVDNKNSLDRAARGYKDINRLAFHILNEGGLLFTFSCSGLLESNLFQKIVADAALDAQCSAQILHRLSQAEDHPTHLAFPEGFYLKGLVCKKA
jgi:23S rRNA (cytosine1962-C5)-methyltransferase